MKKLKERRGLWPGMILALVVALAIGAGFAVYLMQRGGSEVHITTDTISERLEAVGDLVSLEYYYKDVTSLDKPQFNAWGVNIPFTGSRAIFTYEGVMKYGITVADVGVDVTGNTVTLTIPESKLVSHELPPESIEIFDTGRNVFNPVTIADYVDFQVKQKAVMTEKAVEKGLPQTAQEKAGETLTTLLNAMPGMEAYEIVITYAGE